MFSVKHIAIYMCIYIYACIFTYIYWCMCNLLSSLFFLLSQTSYLTFLLCEKLVLDFPLKKFWWWCMTNFCVPGMPFFFFSIITLYSLIERACAFINRIIDLFDYHVLSIYLTYSRPSLSLSSPTLSCPLIWFWLIENGFSWFSLY